MRTQTPQWAVIEATAAMLTGEIRRATTLPELIATGKQYADATTTMRDAFVRIARTEYRTRKAALTAASREDELLQIFIKPH
jgi:hypothetical protein